MKTIRGLEDKELQIPFEGITYIFPPKQTLYVDDKLYEHMKSIWGLSFDYEAKVQKNETITKPRSFKTKSLFVQSEEKATDMVINKSKVPGVAEPDTEVQGSDFYGPGLEIEEGKNLGE